MQMPAIPESEAQRGAASRAIDVISRLPDERFDRVTRLASRFLKAPVALVSVVSDKYLWLKSAVGIDVSEKQLDISFCGHAILGEETFVVRDATQDPRFADNPMVTGSPFIKAYAGHPLHTAGGSRIGALCVIDHKPRKFTREQLQTLRDLAAIVETELQQEQLGESQRAVMNQANPTLSHGEAIDGLTHLWNQVAVMKLLDAELARTSRGATSCVAIVEADYPKAADGAQDLETGGAVLVQLATLIRRAVRAFDIVGYCGGDEFIVVLSNCDIEKAKLICERVRSFVDYENILTPAGLIKASVSVGLTICRPGPQNSLRVIAAADAALSRAEARGGNCVEIEPAVGVRSPEWAESPEDIS